MPTKIINKAELLERVGLTFPTVWKLMREGQFPRSRTLGGKTCWLESEVDQYLATLPTRRYKGDAPQTQVNDVGKKREAAE